jgi:hypothetical protein
MKLCEGSKGKRSQKLWDVDEEEWGEVKSTYQIFSSVLGRTVSEADTTGAKWRTFVIAAGAEIARQAVTETDDEAVTLVHTDPSGYSTHSTSIGTGFAYDTHAMKTEELDGLGNNVGTHGSMSRPPYSGGVMDSPADAITMDDITMGDCALDGIITPCSMVDRSLNSGASLPSHLAQYQHNPGFNFTTHGRGVFSFSYTISGSNSAPPPDGAPYDPDAAYGTRDITYTHFFVASWTLRQSTFEDSRDLSREEIGWLRKDIERLLESSRCASFIESVLQGLFESGITPEGRTNILDFFDEVFEGTVPVSATFNSQTIYIAQVRSQFTSGFHASGSQIRILESRSIAFNPTLTVGNQNYGVLRMPFGRNFYSVNHALASYRGEVMIHELLHLAARYHGTPHSAMASAGYSSALMANLAGDGYAFADPPREQDYETAEAFQHASGVYFNNLLYQACSLTRRPL